MRTEPSQPRAYPPNNGTLAQKRSSGTSKAGEVNRPKVQTRSKLPLMVGGLAVYVVSAYAAYIYFSWKNIPDSPPPAPAAGAETQKNVSHVYDRIAKDYDSMIGWSEFWMGMPLLRKALSRRLEGHVLEVSAGTGRNTKYYPIHRCTSITLVDSSPSMLDQARTNFREQFPYYRNVRFILQDASAPIPMPPEQGYDTVIQTMGLCSHHSPVQLLRNLESVCKKDGGRIILLEHGRSHYGWLNKILDYGASKHADTWGCWWNRDIEGILKESGLKVEKVSRFGYYLGTIYWIEATPRSQYSEGQAR